MQRNAVPQGGIYEAVKGKQQRKVKARSLFCFWPACAGTADRAVSELEMSLLENWPGGWK